MTIHTTQEKILVMGKNHEYKWEHISTRTKQLTQIAERFSNWKYPFVEDITFTKISSLNGRLSGYISIYASNLQHQNTTQSTINAKQFLNSCYGTQYYDTDNIYIPTEYKPTKNFYFVANIDDDGNVTTIAIEIDLYRITDII